MGVLLVKTLPLGDVIHIPPALTDAARAIPGIQPDWMVEGGFAEIPAWHLAVAQVISVTIRHWRKNLWQTPCNDEWRCFKQRLREVDYDLMIDAQGLLKSAWLTRYVGKTSIASPDRGSARESLTSRFYRRAYPVAWGQYAVERTRQLFAQALDCPLPESVGDYGLDRKQLADADPGAPYLVLLHGTTWVTKHWPEVYWRKLAERMYEHGWSVRLPWGSATEREWAGRLAAGLENAVVPSRLSLANMAKVLAGARACVAMGTGLGHLAAVLNVSTPSLFGSTNPGFTGAYGRSQVHLGSDFPCAPCLKKTCTYQPTEEDRKLFDLKREQPLCLTRLNLQRVATQLEVMLLAPEILR